MFEVLIFNFPIPFYGSTNERAIRRTPRDDTPIDNVGLNLPVAKLPILDPTVIVSPKALAAYLQRTGLLENTKYAVLLLNGQSRLVAALGLSDISSSTLTPNLILETALQTRAKAYLVVTTECRFDEDDLDGIFTVGATCGRYDVHLIDCLDLSEQIARSSIWRSRRRQNAAGVNSN